MLKYAMFVETDHTIFEILIGGITMNKTDLIAAVAEKSELSKKDAEKAVNAVINTVVDALN